MRKGKAADSGQSLTAAFPGSPAAKAFKKLAQAADNWPVPDGVRGNLEFFVERLVQAGERRR